MKFNPIGSTFLEGNVTLKVVESKDKGRTCKGCWYIGHKDGDPNKKNYPGSCYTHGHACTSNMRKDRKQVVFTKVK